MSLLRSLTCIISLQITPDKRGDSFHHGSTTNMTSTSLVLLSPFFNHSSALNWRARRVLEGDRRMVKGGGVETVVGKEMIVGRGDHVLGRRLHL